MKGAICVTGQKTQKAIFIKDKMQTLLSNIKCDLGY